MRGKRATLALSLLLALVAGGSVYAFTTSGDQRAAQSTEAVQVLVAALQIPAGQTLQTAVAEGMIKTEYFPASALPSDVIKSVDQTNQGLLSVAPIQPGALIRTSDFAMTLNASKSLQIPTGMVAISVALKEPARVGKFLVPGSKISILDSLVASKGVGTTKVLISEALVLAVGDSFRAGDAAQGNADLITVAVAPKDALRIVTARNNGELTAILIGDSVPPADLSVSDLSLFGGD